MPGRDSGAAGSGSVSVAESARRFGDVRLRGADSAVFLGGQHAERHRRGYQSK